MEKPTKKQLQEAEKKERKLQDKTTDKKLFTDTKRKSKDANQRSLGGF